MKYVKVLLFLLLLSFSAQSIGQTASQNIRGKVVDRVTELPLIGAQVVLMNHQPMIGSATDADGNFLLSGVPAGRQSILVQYVGYKPQTIPEILVVSGKEVVVTIQLEEQIEEMKEVTIKANSNKDRAQNEYASVSARTFSLEEVMRFSGGRNDAARMASNFAGVSTSNDSRNDIVVRGNSPAGVLWKLEGVPIPNPNHFSTLGTTGGPVSAVNTNLLRNSDFMTGAFAAEYGNANASVFDLGFRGGNTKKHEFLFQLNMFSGIEAMAEGPLSKKRESSYLVSYRYSFAGIGSALGIPIGTAAAPQYQDLSFKFDLPSNPKYGKFSVFGIGAYSYINFIGKELTEQDLFADPYSDRYVKSGFGILGLKHTINVGTDAYVRTTLAGSSSASLFDQYDFPDSVNRLHVTKNRDYTNTFRLNSYYNKKFSAKLNMRAGITAEMFHQKSNLEDRDSAEVWIPVRDFKGALGLIQPYMQVQYAIHPKFKVNAGFHGMFLTLNNSWSLEPRVALVYSPHPRHSLTLAYGWHSQMQPLPVYLYQLRKSDGTYDFGNKDLDFTRAHHIVLAYDVKLGDSWRIKLEPYVQFITGAPVEKVSSSFSMLNAGADFVFPNIGYLDNSGTGRNMGVELTVEKFFSRGYYGLLTVSLYDSKYKGSDKIWRNTTFNNQYVVNFLAGKEFKVGKEKQHALTADVKFTTSGGRWYTPIDVEASKLYGTEILKEDEAYSLQYPYYLRLDAKFGFRLNSKKKKISNSFYLDLQNLTFQKNIFERRYNIRTGAVNDVYQIGFFPDLMYRIQF